MPVKIKAIKVDDEEDTIITSQYDPNDPGIAKPTRQEIDELMRRVIYAVEDDIKEGELQQKAVSELILDELALEKRKKKCDSVLEKIQRYGSKRIAIRFGHEDIHGYSFADLFDLHPSERKDITIDIYALTEENDATYLESFEYDRGKDVLLPFGLRETFEKAGINVEFDDFKFPHIPQFQIQARDLEDYIIESASKKLAGETITPETQIELGSVVAAAREYAAAFFKESIDLFEDDRPIPGKPKEQHLRNMLYGALGSKWDELGDLFKHF